MSRRSRLAVAFHVLFDFPDEHVSIGLVHVGCLNVQRILKIHQVLHELIMTVKKKLQIKVLTGKAINKRC